MCCSCCSLRCWLIAFDVELAGAFDSEGFLVGCFGGWNLLGIFPSKCSSADREGISITKLQSFGCRYSIDQNVVNVADAFDPSLNHGQS